MNNEFGQVFLLHGFNVSDKGVGSVGKLRPYFAVRGVPYYMYSYGWLGIAGTYTRNKAIAKNLAKCIEAFRAGSDKKVVVVGHSNGCAIAYLAAKHYGAKIDKAVFINPALENDVEIPYGIKALDVWYSPKDKAVKWSKYLPWHEWGQMGRTGYQGNIDNRVKNYNTYEGFKIKSDSHSDTFTFDDLPYFGPLIVDIALS